MIKSTQTNDPAGRESATQDAATQKAVTFPADFAGRSATREQPPVEIATDDKPNDGKANDGKANDGKATESPPQFRRWKTWWVVAAVAVVLVLLAVGLTIGIVTRVTHERELAKQTAEEADAPPRVKVVRARQTGLETERTLPGNAQAYLEASIYGRTNGYLKSRFVDIGDKVEAGQLLGEISAPDVDAQLAQAKATLQQSKATLESNKASEAYAKEQELRYRTLRTPGAATEQAYENQLMTLRVDTANVHVTQATIQSNEADIQRLTALVGFEKLPAPFKGVITQRNVDPGDLITSDNPSTERLLFRVSQIDPLRVFVEVPQVYATHVKPGQTAILFRREDPERLYHGKVTRTTNALNSSTRTLHTQVDVPNPKGELMPGMFLEVKFIMKREAAPVIVPSDAVITRTGGPKVALMNAEKAVHYQQVQLGRDYGATIEVLTGLRDGDMVIIHPGDDLAEGTKVEPLTDKKGGKGTANGGKQGQAPAGSSATAQEGDTEQGAQPQHEGDEASRQRKLARSDAKSEGSSQKANGQSEQAAGDSNEQN